MQQGGKLCLGKVLTKQGEFHSYGFLIGPRLLLSGSSEPKSGPLGVQWHPNESPTAIEPTNVGSRGISAYRVSESPPESDYAPPVPLDELSPGTSLVIHWGEGSSEASEAKVRSRSDDEGLYLWPARSPPKRDIRAAAVLNGSRLVGAIADRWEDGFYAIGILDLFREWRSQASFAEIRNELFWNLDEILGPVAVEDTGQLASNLGRTRKKATKKTRTAPQQVNPAASSSASPTESPSESSFALPSLSESVQDALAWANAVAKVRGGMISAHVVLLGLYLHRESSRDADSSHFLWDWIKSRIRDPLTFLDPLKGELPKSSLPSFAASELAPDAAALLDRARACAHAVSKSEWISMRHLIGALLLGPDAHEHGRAAGLIGEKGFSFSELADAYLEFIIKTVRGDREAWIAWAHPAPAEQGAEEPAATGTGFGSVRAGYHTDLPIGTDHFGIGDEVATLCSVILDANHPPPLSIGLFGDWGSGKSFFLGKMRERIRDLTADASQARERGMRTTFVARAPQIEFNAWHFVDANLWASLVTHLFAELHKDLFGRKPTPDEEKAEKLYRELETTQKRIEVLERDKRAADELVGQATEKKTQAENDLRDGKRTIETFRRLSPESVKDLVLSRPEVRSRFDALSETLARGREAVGDVDALVRDTLTTAGTIWRFARGNWVLLLVVVALSLAGALLASPVVKGWLNGLQATLGAALVALVGLTPKAVPYLDRVKNFLRTAEAARQDILREGQGMLDRAEIARKEAADRLTIEEGKQQRLKKEIEEARRGLGLESFLQERLGDTTYKTQLGIVAMVRQDFDTLTRRLQSPGIEILDPKTKETRVEMVDRVVLYIDDLDRCPPDRVVEVLQAVHLLCAVPLFVVVVAADPRWLLHSLRKHYEEQWKAGGEGDGSTMSHEEAGRWEATPHQYLEKIFQIPYTLPPMDDSGFRKLVKDLLTPKAEDGDAAAAAPASPPAKRSKEQETESADQTAGPTGSAPISVIPPSPVGTSSAAANPPSGGGETQSIPATSEPNVEPTQGVKTAKEWTPAFDIAPKSLELGVKEMLFLEELSPLVSSPRSAKRLVNVYRLLRANLPVKALREFEDGDFRIAQILLGVLVGFPDQAPEFFRRLQQEKNGDFWSFAKREAETPPPRTSPGEWQQMCQAIAKMKKAYSGVTSASRFAAWTDDVSRYSFRAGHLLRYLSEDHPEDGPPGKASRPAGAMKK